MSKVDFYALGLKPHYTFETLVIGPHNQMAAAASMEVSKKPGVTYNPLFLFGSAGVGKTHLMQAVASALIEKNNKLKVKYMSAERFASEVIAAIGEDNVMAVREHYSQLDILLVDDIQFLAESKATQGEFFHIFNNLHEQNRQIIMAADRPPNQLTMLDQAIRSRLEWGLSVDVKIPDVQTRLQILKVKQEQQGLLLNDDILMFAAQNLVSNVRELEGFLKRLHAYVALSHQDLTMELVQQVVREVLPVGTIPTSVAVPVASPPTAVPSAPAIAPTPPAPAPVQVAPLPPVAAPIPPLPPVPVPTPVSPPAVAPAPVQNGSAKKSAPEPVPEISSKPPAPVEIRAVPVVPPAPIIPEIPEDVLSDATDENLVGLKEIGTVFFYPQGKEKELDVVHRKFQDVIKKHKLKFRLKRISSYGYECKGKMNYSTFVDVCKQNKVPVAIVIGPPPDVLLQEQDFYDLLSVTLDVQGVSLQLVNWAEINKDYRYLNLALDIALVRSR